MEKRFKAKDGIVVDSDNDFMWMQKPLEGKFTFWIMKAEVEETGAHSREIRDWVKKMEEDGYVVEFIGA